VAGLPRHDLSPLARHDRRRPPRPGLVCETAEPLRGKTAAAATNFDRGVPGHQGDLHSWPLLRQPEQRPGQTGQTATAINQAL